MSDKFVPHRALRGLTVMTAALLAHPVAATAAATPIEHVVVLFQENISFDHYFGTYPHAQNLAGEPRFLAAPQTPTVNGLTPALLAHNPNKDNPFRLAPAQAMTCDMDHDYRAEQQAFDGGLMDGFVEHTSSEGSGCAAKGVMAYFDGNTVTALWNYAQRFALSDNSFGTGFGPSTPGALNLISGNTHGVTAGDLTVNGEAVAIAGTMIGDPDPQFDDCSNPKAGLAAMRGTTIGHLLNAAHVSWGWFEGGFRPTEMRDGKVVCGRKSVNIAGKPVPDYSAHHEPFQYYEDIANPHHLPPSSPAAIGQSDQANHQYDLDDFFTALHAGRLPAVSFVKARRFQDGHAGYSDPTDEQAWLVEIVNAMQRAPAWRSTAIIIAYDDSDGWYDHAMPPILNGSNTTGLDALNGEGRCGNAQTGAYPDRCGYGPRLPLLILSPFARRNFVDHALTDQTSIIRFVEDNWALGRIGNQSMDALAGSLDGMFDFAHPDARPFLLDQHTGMRAALHRKSRH
ncbi:MAG TPA: alkaline phosphatase family protein [Rhizomicrobium sp.]|jgi:phospholipase C